MANIDEMAGNYGDIETIANEIENNSAKENNVGGTQFRQVENALPVKTGFWSKVKAFLFQEIDWNKEIKVELTPYQQKVEDEINEFLHQEITWTKVKSFLFKEIKF